MSGERITIDVDPSSEDGGAFQRAMDILAASDPKTELTLRLAPGVYGKPRLSPVAFTTVMAVMGFGLMVELVWLVNRNDVLSQPGLGIAAIVALCAQCAVVGWLAAKRARMRP